MDPQLMISACGWIKSYSRMVSTQQLFFLVVTVQWLVKKKKRLLEIEDLSVESCLWVSLYNSRFLISVDYMTWLTGRFISKTKRILHRPGLTIGYNRFPLPSPISTSHLFSLQNVSSKEIKDDKWKRKETFWFIRNSFPNVWTHRSFPFIERMSQSIEHK